MSARFAFLGGPAAGSTTHGQLKEFWETQAEETLSSFLKAGCCVAFTEADLWGIRANEVQE